MAGILENLSIGRGKSGIYGRVLKLLGGTKLCLTIRRMQVNAGR